MRCDEKERLEMIGKEVQVVVSSYFSDSTVSESCGMLPSRSCVLD